MSAMSPATNMEIVRQWVEQVWNHGDLERIADFQPPTFANEGALSSIEEARQWHSTNHSTFPDIRYSIDDMFATDDRVAMCWSAIATHHGTLWNMIPPTGKCIK